MSWKRRALTFPASSASAASLRLMAHPPANRNRAISTENNIAFRMEMPRSCTARSGAGVGEDHLHVCSSASPLRLTLKHRRKGLAKLSDAGISGGEQFRSAGGAL